MNYQIDGYTIKSQNAARSYKQRSIYLKNLLLQEPNHNKALDYGCGKLRYSDQICETSVTSLFVDSEIQLNRLQDIHGLRTSVKDYVKLNYKNSSVISIEDYKPMGDCDFILCANVISAIPIEKQIDYCISNIIESLTDDGYALFVTQYDDPYFNSFKSRTNTKAHLFGFLTIGDHDRNSYYGIITPDILKNLLQRNGLSVKRYIINKGTVYMYSYKGY